MSWYNPFKSKKPVSTLSAKQVEVLNYIDETLVELHNGKYVSGEMKVKLAGVSYINTMLNVSAIIKRITLEPGQSYIPRSVALVVDPEGNWTFFYSVRESIGSDDITCRLFLEVLTRTNNQR